MPMAGVPAPAGHTLINAQERIDPAAAALPAITVEDPDKPRLPADGTRLRLRSLMAMGHGYTRLAHAAGTSPADIRKIIEGRAAEVTPQLQDRVRRVWETWWDKTPPARTAAQRAAATKARDRARRGRWCTPSASTKTSSTDPATSPGTAGCPPQAPAPHPPWNPPGQSGTG
jgi:hypothetical protein